MRRGIVNYCFDARASTTHFPGIGRYVFNLLRAMGPMLKDDEELTVLWDPNETSHWNLSTLQSGRIQLVAARVSPFSLFQLWILPNLLRRLAVDLYHNPYPILPYRTDQPMIVTIYDLIPIIHPRSVPLRARLLFRVSTARATRTTSFIITVSESTRRDLRRCFKLQEETIAPIPLAADPCFVRQAENEVERVQEVYSLGQRFVLYVGTNKPHKNLIRLVEAWHITCRDLPESTSGIQLVIAGPWDNRYQQAKERARQFENIRIIGPVKEKDLPGLYSGAAFFVYPSLYEGFGLPVLEAMACGTPVACSSSSSLVEVAGDAALLFDPEDTREMARALSRLMKEENLRRELGKRALERADQFSWDRTARETLQIYRKAVSSS